MEELNAKIEANTEIDADEDKNNAVVDKLSDDTDVDADVDADADADADANVGADADFGILREMMEAGVIYGHKKSKTNPKFKQYIYVTRNGVEIIDLSKTLSALDRTAEFLKNLIKENKKVLLVAIQPAAKEAVNNLVKEFNFSYINDHWIGGLLTNLKVLSKRIEYFKETQSNLEKGKFEKYTKKERVMISRNIDRMKKMFIGLEDLTRLPDVLFVIDTSIKGHMTAIREAKIMKIPIIGIIDSDDDPDLIDYMIPANDHAKTSIEWVVNKIKEKLVANH
ncbi:MAG TPA: 30S ribosomal protein S2 [Candidatus Wolfebacteria bacterium]|nr:30S ribosomal protein S2 [Candidatus Wolfebacteria bacterium]